MSFGAYLRFAGWEFLLVAAAALSLTYTLLDGFYIAPELQYGPVPALVVVACVAALYMVGFNKTTTRFGAPAYALLAVVCLGVAASMSPVELTADVEQNPFIFVLINVFVATIAYLLARTRVGCALLFMFGSFACSWIQFFYERDELVWLLLFVASSLVLVVYKNYQQSARTATSVKSLSFSAGFTVAVAATAVALGAGAALWFGVIAPLSPGAVDLKLITEYRALETKQVQGTSSVFLTPNTDLTSDKTNDETRTTDDLKQDDSGVSMPAKAKGSAAAQAQASGTVMGIDMSALSNVFDFENNTQEAWRNLIIAVLVVIALVVAFFVLRRVLRTRRLNRIRQLSPSEQVSELYRFILGFLGKVGFTVPAGSTLTEFAANNQAALVRFDAAGNGSFAALTDAYAKVAYGVQHAGVEQADACAAYYTGLWKGAREQLGNVKYFFRSFRL